jgi:hypothetical protein
MIKNATIAISKIPPTIPPAIAPMLGEATVLAGDFGVAVAASGVTASPTAKVEKWFTTKEHLHSPLCTTPVHGDMGSGLEEISPALASDTANPCKMNHCAALLKARISNAECIHAPACLMTH